MIYINETGKQNEVWLPKPYDTAGECPECPDSASTWNSGYTSGYTDGYGSGFTDGAESVDCDDAYNSGYNSGYTDGVNASGGDYASGYTDGFDHGYESGVTDGFSDGYSSGHTDGYSSGHTDGWGEGYTSGATDGINSQKALLSADTFTQNGTYTRADGWSSVTVNVAQTGYTLQDLENAYNSGWTEGYGSGYTDGYNDASGETPTAATAISITVPRNMTSGYTSKAVVTSTPHGAPTNLSYTSSDNAVAIIDSAGTITAISTGSTTICVTDSISRLSACSELNVVEMDPYIAAPLTFVVISGGTIGWDNSSTNIEIDYSIDNGQTWQNFTTLNVNAGDQVTFRGTGHTGINDPQAGEEFLSSRFTASTGTYFNAEGNINSLLNHDYIGITELEPFGWATFFGLFSGNTGLVSAENLKLPAQPGRDCYRDMFACCSNLTTAPELPAENTFWAPGCYVHMFNSCSNLNYIKCLENSYRSGHTTRWVVGVSPTGTFVKAASADNWPSGNSGIPDNWTVVDAQ